MKTQLIVKTVVVAMATFGAFAFNRNTQPNLFNYKDGGVCINIEIPCTDTGAYLCEIIIGNTEYNIYDLSCNRFIKHNSPVPFKL